jgi:nuclear protein localization protein 4 homolog
LQLIFSFKLNLFQDKDQYGNEVQKLARPLPVEYLLVDLPTSSPLTPIYTFPSHKQPFPVENRLIDGQLQDFGSLHKYMQTTVEEGFLAVRKTFFFFLSIFDCD